MDKDLEFTLRQFDDPSSRQADVVRRFRDLAHWLAQALPGSNATERLHKKDCFNKLLDAKRAAIAAASKVSC